MTAAGKCRHDWAAVGMDPDYPALVQMRCLVCGETRREAGAPWYGSRCPYGTTVTVKPPKREGRETHEYVRCVRNAGHHEAGPDVHPSIRSHIGIAPAHGLRVREGDQFIFVADLVMGPTGVWERVEREGPP